MTTESGQAAAAGSMASGVVNGSSPQWKRVGAPSSPASRIKAMVSSPDGCATRVHRVQHQAPEAELADGPGQQGQRLLAVPRMQVDEAPEPSGVLVAHLGDEPERLGVDAGKAGARLRSGDI
jgi:hypothetical protein